MAQVNSTPGQSQTAGNVAVAPAAAEVGTENVKTAAVAKSVPYAQNEPGLTVTTKRS